MFYIYPLVGQRENAMVIGSDRITTKPCKECKFWQEKAPQCQHDNNKEAPDYVSGYGFIPVYYNAYMLRKQEDHCGPDGKWFVAKEVKETKGD
jgi:hypothetical protein